MPSHVWHDSKKLHDYSVFKHIEQKTNVFIDWQIISLFYSALHYVDSTLYKLFSYHPKNHNDRKNYIKSSMRPIENKYRLLYHLGWDARYSDVTLNQRDLEKAITYYDKIKETLTPKSCNRCGRENFINIGKCIGCRDPL